MKNRDKRKLFFISKRKDESEEERWSVGDESFPKIPANN